MPGLIKKILKHPLLSGSLIMLVGSNLANFISYLYHLVLGRMLGPSDYGEVAAIISFVSLLTAIFSFVGIVIIKFVSSAKAKEKSSVISWFMKHFVIFGIFYSLLVLLASGLISDFLHIDISVSYLLAPILFCVIVVFLYKSFLQGLIKFKENVIVSNSEMLGRLLIGTLLVYLGMEVFGAVSGILLAYLLIAIVLTISFRKQKLLIAASKFKGSLGVFKYALPVLGISIATTSLVSSDVVLAKHFLEPFEAGVYGAMSNISKIMFYATAPITAVMFPLVSQKYARKQNYKKMFLFALLLVVMAVGFMFILYLFFPEFIVKLFYGQAYLTGSMYLPLFAIFGSFYAIASVMVSFYMSIERTKVVFIIGTAAILQYVAIFYFHESITQIIGSTVVAVVFLTVCLLVYLVKLFNQPNSAVLPSVKEVKK